MAASIPLVSSASDVAITNLTLFNASAVATRRRLQSSGLELVVAYTLLIRAAGATDVSAVAASLKTQLTAALSSGSFSSALASAASALGVAVVGSVDTARSLSSVDSIAVAVVRVSTRAPSQAPTPAPTSPAPAGPTPAPGSGAPPPNYTQLFLLFLLVPPLLAVGAGVRLRRAVAKVAPDAAAPASAGPKVFSLEEHRRLKATSAAQAKAESEAEAKAKAKAKATAKVAPEPSAPAPAAAAPPPVFSPPPKRKFKLASIAPAPSASGSAAVPEEPLPGPSPASPTLRKFSLVAAASTRLLGEAASPLTKESGGEAVGAETKEGDYPDAPAAASGPPAPDGSESLGEAKKKKKKKKKREAGEEGALGSEEAPVALKAAALAPLALPGVRAPPPGSLLVLNRTDSLSGWVEQGEVPDTTKAAPPGHIRGARGADDQGLVLRSWARVARYMREARLSPHEAFEEIDQAQTGRVGEVRSLFPRGAFLPD